MSTATDYDALSIEDLDNTATAFRVQTLRLGGFLTERCGGDVEQVRKEIRLAMDLPPNVLIRRAKEAEAIVEAGEIPSVSQVAAIVARIMATVDTITATMQREQAGHVLQ